MLVLLCVEVLASASVCSLSDFVHAGAKRALPYWGTYVSEAQIETMADCLMEPVQKAARLMRGVPVRARVKCVLRPVWPGMAGWSSLRRHLRGRVGVLRDSGHRRACVAKDEDQLRYSRDAAPLRFAMAFIAHNFTHTRYCILQHFKSDSSASRGTSHSPHR